MTVVLLVWLLLAPLSAWIIGAGIRAAERRRPVDADEAAGQAAGDLACRPSTAAPDQLVAISA